MNKKLIIFLLLNLILAIFLGIHLFYKDSDIVEKKETMDNKEHTQKNMTSMPAKELITSHPLEKVQNPAVITNSNPVILEKSEATKIVKPLSCIVYGPVTIDNKNILESLLQKANLLSSTNIIGKPIYEIYWDLGNNKNNAFSLFEKQKNGGPLQNDKFKLKLDQNNNWIVPIAEITADENNAATITKELADKANHINAGGKWQYRTKENVYFYQFSDQNILPQDIKEVMNKTLALPHAGC